MDRRLASRLLITPARGDRIMSVSTRQLGTNLLGSLGIDARQVAHHIEKDPQQHGLAHLADGFNEASNGFSAEKLKRALERGLLPMNVPMKKPDAKTCPCPDNFAQPRFLGDSDAPVLSSGSHASSVFAEQSD